MRCIGILSTALSVTLLLLGCGKGTSTEEAKAQRDEYVRTMSKRLDELNVKYEELKVSAAKVTDEAKAGLEKKLEIAKTKRDAAAKQLDALKEASLERWEKVKDGVGDAFDDLKKAFD